MSELLTLRELDEAMRLLADSSNLLRPVLDAKTFIPRAEATIRTLLPLVEALAKMPCESGESWYESRHGEGRPTDCGLCPPCQARQVVKGMQSRKETT